MLMAVNFQITIINFTFIVIIKEQVIIVDIIIAIKVITEFHIIKGFTFIVIKVSLVDFDSYLGLLDYLIVSYTIKELNFINFPNFIFRLNFTIIIIITNMIINFNSIANLNVNIIIIPNHYLGVKHLLKDD